MRVLGQGCAKLVSSKWSVASGEENVGGLRLEAEFGKVEVKVEVEWGRGSCWRLEVGGWKKG